MRCWLVKSEPEAYSIDDLKREGKTYWSGVRNYQARNFMRDQMQVGDPILFYHSNAAPPGVAGMARVCKKAHPDFTAWDPQDEHYDPKAGPGSSLWMMVDIEFVEKFPRFVSLQELRDHPQLKTLLLLKPGQRLSIQPVEKKHFEIIQRLGQKIK
ncbi:MAG TPA: EVE domain-containing protein [Deltaproteobacteria bacterium]|nr:EVE domain-containing protein [Deltaproteobacteria bacterium]